MRWQSPGSIGQGRDRGAQVSKQLINEYRAELDRLRAVSGSRREGVLSEAFKDLLKRWGRSNDLTCTPRGTRIYPDGAVLHALRDLIAEKRMHTRFCSAYWLYCSRFVLETQLSIGHNEA